MHIERFTKAQRRKTRHKEHMGTPKQSCSNLHSAVRCVHVSQGYGRWLSLREYAWFVKSWLCPCRSLFFVVTRCGIVTSTVLLYYAWSHIDLRVLLRQVSSKPTRIHLFGCRRLSSRWPCRWPGSRKSFHNVQRCAKMCKDSWFCKETFAPQQCRKGVVVLLHRGLTICFRRRPSLKHLTKNTKNTKNTSRTCPRWGSPVFYIALVLAWNPGRSFLEWSFLCKKRCWVSCSNLLVP